MESPRPPAFDDIVEGFERLLQLRSIGEAHLRHIEKHRFRSRSRSLEPVSIYIRPAQIFGPSKAWQMLPTFHRNQFHLSVFVVAPGDDSDAMDEVHAAMVACRKAGAAPDSTDAEKAADAKRGAADKAFEAAREAFEEAPTDLRRRALPDRVRPRSDPAIRRRCGPERGAPRAAQDERRGLTPRSEALQ